MSWTLKDLLKLTYMWVERCKDDLTFLEGPEFLMETKNQNRMYNLFLTYLYQNISICSNTLSYCTMDFFFCGKRFRVTSGNCLQACQKLFFFQTYLSNHTFTNPSPQQKSKNAITNSSLFSFRATITAVLQVEDIHTLIKKCEDKDQIYRSSLST